MRMSRARPFGLVALGILLDARVRRTRGTVGNPNAPSRSRCPRALHSAHTTPFSSPRSRTPTKLAWLRPASVSPRLRCSPTAKRRRRLLPGAAPGSSRRRGPPGCGPGDTSRARDRSYRACRLRRHVKTKACLFKPFCEAPACERFAACAAEAPCSFAEVYDAHFAFVWRSARRLGAPAPVSAPVATTLRAETELMRAGLAALHGGDPLRALTLFDQHARAFPAGVLADERDVERITALCDLGRNLEARGAAVSFLRRRPDTPPAGRILSSCGSPSPSIP